MTVYTKILTHSFNLIVIDTSKIEPQAILGLLVCSPIIQNIRVESISL